MDAIEAMLTRRSIRKFKSDPIPEATLETILKAAMFAPSACNQQPWHFVVVDQRDQLDAIAANHPYAQMVLQAPVAVIVCADTALETCRGNWAIDCSAAMQNLLLAAHAQGLGGVWVGIYPVEERINAFNHLLGLPAYVAPLCLAALGYADEPLPQADRFKPERIHKNRW
jgi:nitroreductase